MANDISISKLLQPSIKPKLELVEGESWDGITKCNEYLMDKYIYFDKLSIVEEQRSNESPYVLTIYFTTMDILDLNSPECINILFDIGERIDNLKSIDELVLDFPSGTKSFSKYDVKNIFTKLENVLNYIYSKKKDTLKCNVGCYLPEYTILWAKKNFFASSPFKIVPCKHGCSYFDDISKEFKKDQYILRPPAETLDPKNVKVRNKFERPSFISTDLVLLEEVELNYFTLRIYDQKLNVGKQISSGMKYVEIDYPLKDIIPCYESIKDLQNIKGLLEARSRSDAGSKLSARMLRERLANIVEKKGYSKKIAYATTDFMLNCGIWYEMFKWDKLKEVILRSGSPSNLVILEGYGKCFINYCPPDKDISTLSKWLSYAGGSTKDFITHTLEMSLTPELNDVEFTGRFSIYRPPFSEGYTIIARLQDTDALGLTDLALYGTCPIDSIAYMIMRRIRPRSNITFIGGVGSGKTVSQFSVDTLTPPTSIKLIVGDMFEGKDPAQYGFVTYYFRADKAGERGTIGIDTSQVITRSLRSRSEQDILTEIITPEDTYAWIYSRLCDRAGSQTYHAKNRYEFLKRVVIDLNSKGLSHGGELLQGAIDVIIECGATQDRQNSGKMAYKWMAISEGEKELYSIGQVLVPKIVDYWIYDPIFDNHVRTYELPSNHRSYVPYADWVKKAFSENINLQNQSLYFPIPVTQLYCEDEKNCEYGVWLRMVEWMYNFEKDRRVKMNLPEFNKLKDKLYSITPDFECYLATLISTLILTTIADYNKKYYDNVNAELNKLNIDDREEFSNKKTSIMADELKVYNKMWIDIHEILDEFFKTFLENHDDLAAFKKLHKLA